MQITDRKERGMQSRQVYQSKNKVKTFVTKIIFIALLFWMKEEKTIFKPLAGIEPHIFG